MKLKTMKRCVILVIIALILCPAITYAAYKNSEQNTKQIRANLGENEEQNLSREQRDTLDLINEYRNENGLKSLKPYTNLQEIARIKAEDLVENNYFSHTSNILGNPFEMLSSNGINYRIAGENLAGNTTPERAVQAWINSESHRANILEERFEYTGIYVIDSEVYGKIYVQIFVGL